MKTLCHLPLIVCVLGGSVPAVVHKVSTIHQLRLMGPFISLSKETRPETFSNSHLILYSRHLLLFLVTKISTGKILELAPVSPRLNKAKQLYIKKSLSFWTSRHWSVHMRQQDLVKCSNSTLPGESFIHPVIQITFIKLFLY